MPVRETDMDYEKKYNEALERARRIRNGEDNWGYCDLTEIVPALEEIFPELRESEDERIRKALINILNEYKTLLVDEGTSSEQAIAYLEKQKEQKPAEWGEEDEDNIETLIHVIRGQLRLSEYRQKYIVNWLKSLRPQPQKLEDWTEEDERLLGDVLGCITLVQTYKACGDLKDFKTEYTGEELRSFVRSLKSRPRKQPRWKPSKEQLEALKRAKDYCWTQVKLKLYFQENDIPLLEMLYNDLLKLK